MIHELQEQWLTDNIRQELRARIEHKAMACKQQLQRTSTPSQFQQLTLQVQALNGAITILNAIEKD
ncbi:EscE/YscE/SsaE family type III secretion system needle protein co-chaperone [Pseudomonas fontis]|uniref:EscE/YscE/SsaE family type III secretion system needle protein co-chaperone n=1 Tax=Pseudomonas fontis TaxID=2942633 RepID=A0ABT5NZR7_9PSED|nr:EscE/YscE/SsaE family type III secretion system needle protein co-chaperone [Pseudomonas fontis]MDD0976411.1 EscE/YscE/SsaE family type III secretion system needle protein co-chaperone [Pseudomonas fontis]MDD0993703.1 EscE/YscE/SsaE family type III secretion system needle protein co-chaperone [Pseudomonas fontis]